MKGAALVLFTLAAALSSSVVLAAELDVKASIGLERILVATPEYTASLNGKTSSVAIFSPHNSGFVILTRRGDVASDSLVERLLYWRTVDIQAALARGESAPAAKLLFEQSTREDFGLLQKISWLDEERLAFIGMGENGCSQAFVVDVATAAVRQLTHHSGDVVSFASKNDLVIFYAREPQPRRTVLGPGLSLFDLLHSERRNLRSLVLYQQRKGEAALRIQVPGTSFEFNPIWIAPDSRSAVVLATASPQPHWARYRTGASWDTYAPGEGPDAGFDRRVSYHRVDLESNTSKPLFDAPAGIKAYNDTPKAVFWSEDGRRLIVSNTYAPLEGPQAARRAQGPATVELDLSTGAVTPIFWEPMDVFGEPAPQRPNQIVSLSWDAHENVLTVERDVGGGAQSSERVRYWRVAAGWNVGKAVPVARELPFTVARQEGINTPPRLVARGRSGREMIVFDPTPELARMSKGRAEIFEWKDENGHRWRGSITFPVGYVPGNRYPLVLQSHGFSEQEFLIDGPFGATNPFAAQPLANAGFVVLQAPDVREATTNDEREGALVAAGWRAGVRRLIDNGIAEAGKVGVAGFSRTGYHVLAALAEDPQLYQAAVISDSVQYNYWQLTYMVADQGMLDSFLRVTGPLEGGIPTDAWLRRQPLYRIDSKAAVRIEATQASPVTMWETYAVLKLKGAPTEILAHTSADHSVVKPSERMASQGGAVEWFRFWLQGWEDPDPGKARQYRRWREMRNSGARR